MSTEKFQALTARGAVLTTETNALVTDTNTALGPVYDNSANRDRYAFAQLNLSSLSGVPADGAVVELFAIPSLDGTVYLDGGGAIDPSTFTYLGTFLLRPVATVQVLSSQRFEVMPTKMKFMVRNSTGLTFGATGTTVTLFTTNRDIV